MDAFSDSSDDQKIPHLGDDNTKQMDSNPYKGEVFYSASYNEQMDTLNDISYDQKIPLIWDDNTKQMDSIPYKDNCKIGYSYPTQMDSLSDRDNCKISIGYSYTTQMDSLSDRTDPDVLQPRDGYTDEMDSPTDENNVEIPHKMYSYSTQMYRLPDRNNGEIDDQVRSCCITQMYRATQSRDGGTEQTDSSNNRLSSYFLCNISNFDENTIIDFLQLFKEINQKLSSVRDETTGKTCLMKVLLQPNRKTSDTAEKLLRFAEETGDLADLLNAQYTDDTYHGQTALHIAIERKLENIVQHLVMDGADLDIEADGQFFQIQKDRNDWFYFGGYPLSLAACTKQQAIVQFLICNKFKCANIYNKDHLGNTVLHALILSANDSQEHCDDLMIIYNKILKESVKKMQKDSTLKALETIKNNEGLTPLQLAAKNGKVKILKHILQRNFDEDESGMKQLSRRILEWNYGPIFCYLYDLSEVDTVEKNSVLEIAVYGKNHNESQEILTMEPIKELLDIKWEKYACFMFYFSLILYLSYIIIFTIISTYKHQFNEISNTTSNFESGYIWYITGQIYTSVSALLLIITVVAQFFHSGTFQFPFNIANSYFYFLFIFQGALVLFVIIWNWIRQDYQDGVLAFALILGWYNVLYFSRGIKITGIYSIMIQKMIIRDVSSFIFVYVVFLIGFGAALSSLTNDCSEGDLCSQYTSVLSASLELFKLTLGLGDLSYHEHASYPVLILILTILYVIFTFVLLLNMLIALMGKTVESLNDKTESIWRIQRAMAILDLEKILPRAWRKRCQHGKICTGIEMRITHGKDKTFLRVNEVLSETVTNKGCRMNEDPGICKEPNKSVDKDKDVSKVDSINNEDSGINNEIIKRAYEAFSENLSSKPYRFKIEEAPRGNDIQKKKKADEERESSV